VAQAQSGFSARVSARISDALTWRPSASAHAARQRTSTLAKARKQVVPSPRHKYPDRNTDLTEISLLHFGELVCLIMTWSRYASASTPRTATCAPTYETTTRRAALDPRELPGAAWHAGLASLCCGCAAADCLLKRKLLRMAQRKRQEVLLRRQTAVVNGGAAPAQSMYFVAPKLKLSTKLDSSNNRC
jgi:hypothetical protein